MFGELIPRGTAAKGLMTALESALALTFPPGHSMRNAALVLWRARNFTVRIRFSSRHMRVWTDVVTNRPPVWLDEDGKIREGVPEGDVDARAAGMTIARWEKPHRSPLAGKLTILIDGTNVVRSPARFLSIWIHEFTHALVANESANETKRARAAGEIEPTQMRTWAVESDEELAYSVQRDFLDRLEAYAQHIGFESGDEVAATWITQCAREDGEFARWLKSQLDAAGVRHDLP